MLSLESHCISFHHFYQFVLPSFNDKSLGEQSICINQDSHETNSLSRLGPVEVLIITGQIHILCLKILNLGFQQSLELF